MENVRRGVVHRGRLVQASWLKKANAQLGPASVLEQIVKLLLRQLAIADLADISGKCGCKEVPGKCDCTGQPKSVDGDGQKGKRQRSVDCSKGIAGSISHMRATGKPLKYRTAIKCTCGAGNQAQVCIGR